LKTIFATYRFVHTKRLLFGSGSSSRNLDEPDEPEEFSFPDVGQNHREADHQKTDGFTSQND